MTSPLSLAGDAITREIAAARVAACVGRIVARVGDKRRCTIVLYEGAPAMLGTQRVVLRRTYWTADASAEKQAASQIMKAIDADLREKHGDKPARYWLERDDGAEGISFALTAGAATQIVPTDRDQDVAFGFLAGAVVGGLAALAALLTADSRPRSVAEQQRAARRARASTIRKSVRAARRKTKTTKTKTTKKRKTKEKT